MEVVLKRIPNRINIDAHSLNSPSMKKQAIEDKSL